LFGHEDVAVDAEAVTLAGALEDLFDSGAGFVVGDVGVAVVATEGDEMAVAAALISLETLGHLVSLAGFALCANIPLMRKVRA